jgi:hypothetical protein
MRRLFAVVLLFGIGCGSGSNPDTVAARGLVQSLYENADSLSLTVEEPEYAAIPKIPKKGVGSSPADRPAACGVRVKFRWRNGGRTTTDDWVVWVTSDHKAIDWSGNADGDDWRRYVRSFAKQ